MSSRALPALSWWNGENVQAANGEAALRSHRERLSAALPVLRS